MRFAPRAPAAVLPSAGTASSRPLQPSRVRKRATVSAKAERSGGRTGDGGGEDEDEEAVDIDLLAKRLSEEAHKLRMQQAEASSSLEIDLGTAGSPEGDDGGDEGRREGEDWEKKQRGGMQGAVGEGPFAFQVGKANLLGL